jgi:DNA-binding CsgD family transcriptional regulator
MSALRARLDDARRGVPRLVLVEGSAGMGKSTLMNRFADELDPDLVLRAGGDESEMLIPYAVIDQLIGCASPEAFDGLSFLGSPLKGDLDPLAVGADLVGLIGNLQERQPLVVVIVDDLHWADSASAVALLFAFRRMPRDRVLGLVSARSGELARLGESWASGIERDQRAERVRLEGLPAAELSELAITMGVDGLSERALTRLIEHTGGSPLHCRALFEELSADTLNRMSADLPAPRALSSLVLSRVSALSPAAQELVTSAAVLGFRCLTSLAVDLSEVGDPVTALDELVGGGLVVEEVSPPRHTVFSHSLVQRAIYDDLSPSHRQSLHLRAAELTAGSTSLLHRARAAVTFDAGLAGDLEDAATLAIAEHTPAQAVAWLVWSADLTSDRADHERRLLDAFLIAMNSGDLTMATDLKHRLDEFDRSPRLSALLGHFALVSGQFALAERLLGEAWNAAADDVQVNSRARGAASLAMYLLLIGRSREAVEWGERALSTVDNDAALELHIRNFLALNLVLNGRGSDGMALLDGFPEPPAEMPMDTTSVLVFRGISRLFLDDIDGAVRDLSTASSRHRRGLSFSFDTHGLTYLAEAEYRAGAWDDASVHADFAVSLAHDAHHVWDFGFVHAQAALVPAGRGEWSVAMAHIEEALSWANGFGIGTALAMTATTKASMMAAQRNWTGVMEAVAPVRSFGQLDTLGRPGVHNWRPLEVEALIALAHLDDAADALAEYQRLIPEAGLRSAEAEAARLQGLLDEARGDTSGCDRSFERALELVAGLAIPLQVGILELADGQRLLRRGRLPEAKEMLQSAEVRFRSLRARPFMTHCGEALIEAGASPDLEEFSPAFGLTPTELVVARKVAGGLTNREVASEMYVSVKAIEFHLSNVFDKLGIRSRRQIRRSLGSVSIGVAPLP